MDANTLIKEHGLSCCDTNVKPAYTIFIGDAFMGSGYYLPHAVECTLCGMVYEVQRYSYNQEMIGGQYMDNYTVSACRPVLRPYVSNDHHSEELKLIKRVWLRKDTRKYVRYIRHLLFLNRMKNENAYIKGMAEAAECYPDGILKTNDRGSSCKVCDHLFAGHACSKRGMFGLEDFKMESISCPTFRSLEPHDTEMFGWDYRLGTNACLAISRLTRKQLKEIAKLFSTFGDSLTRETLFEAGYSSRGVPESMKLNKVCMEFTKIITAPPTFYYNSCWGGSDRFLTQKASSISAWIGASEIKMMAEAKTWSYDKPKRT